MHGLFVFAAALALFDLSTLASGFSLRAYEGSQLSEALAKLNKEMTSSNYVEAQFDGFKYNTSMSTGSMINVHIGKLNTISQCGKQQTLKVTVEKGQPEKISVYFDLTLGLDQLYATYDFDINYFRFNQLTGSMRIDVANNAARFVGTVFVKQPGSCEAVLKSAEISYLMDYKIEIYPKTDGNRLISKITQFLYNNKSPIPSNVFKHYFEESFKSEEFKQTFSNIVCKIYQ